MEDPPPHDRGTVTDNSSESTDRSERVPPVILSLLPLFLTLFPSVSSQLVSTLSLCLSLSLFLLPSGGRKNPLPRAHIHNQAVSIEALAAPHNPSFRPFFAHVFSHGAQRSRRAKIFLTKADDTVDDANTVLANRGDN